MNIIEGIQRSFTKHIKGMRDISYAKSLYNMIDISLSIFEKY